MLKGIDAQQIKLISQIYFDKFEVSLLVTRWGFRENLILLALISLKIENE